MSIELLDDDVKAIAFYLSSERLANFHAIAGSDRDAIYLHQRVLAVGAALAPIVAIIEIAIRNAVCENLRTSFGAPDWLRNPPVPFVWGKEQAKGIGRAVDHAQRAAYAKLSNVEKKSLDIQAYPAGVPSGLGHEKRVKARQGAISVGNGQVIAQLSLYFWKRLFSKDYENTLWKRSLKSIFPNKTLIELMCRMRWRSFIRREIALPTMNRYSICGSPNCWEQSSSYIGTFKRNGPRTILP